MTQEERMELYRAEMDKPPINLVDDSGAVSKPMPTATDTLAGFAAFGSEGHVEAQEGDYVGEDGYLMCGKCHTRKETIFPLSGRMVPCMCACRKAQAEEDKDERQRREEENRVRELLRMSIIDDNFYDCTFDRFVVRNDDDAQLLRRLQNYVVNFDEMLRRNVGLLLYGPPGTGKTFAANCVANALIAKRVPVFVTSIIQLTMGNPDDLPRTLNTMKNARLLILDDFGAERNTDFKAEQVFSVINARVNQQRPMIITSNIGTFKDDDIRRQRVYDRIAAACVPILVNGTSRRQENRVSTNADIMRLLNG